MHSIPSEPASSCSRGRKEKLANEPSRLASQLGQIADCSDAAPSPQPSTREDRSNQPRPRRPSDQKAAETDLVTENLAPQPPPIHLPETSVAVEFVHYDGRVIIPASEVMRLTNFSRTHLWRLSKNGENDFPAPFKMSANKVGWDLIEIKQWLASRPRVAWASGSGAA